MELNLIRRLRERINEKLVLVGDTSDEELLETVEETVLNSNDEGTYFTANEKYALIQRIYHSYRGMDILQPLLEDEYVNEIMVNAYNEIFYEKQGVVVSYPYEFESADRLTDLIQMVAAKVNRIVNESSPIVDARLSDGSRVHIVLPPVALKGPAMTIRKFPAIPFTMERLLAEGTVTEEAAFFLKRLVQAKYNIFISGGTGSGKTTFLNALSNLIPQDERIVTIEDIAELQIMGVLNVVKLETRNPNTEGKGEISMQQLIKASLRMRPNRIIIGEVRGGEALDMLQAMNTGHEGSISTGHANSVNDMFSRIETMVLSRSPLPLEAVRRQIGSAIDIMIHLSRVRNGKRQVMEIVEVIEYREGSIRTNPLFHWSSDVGQEGVLTACGELQSMTKLNRVNEGLML